MRRATLILNPHAGQSRLFTTQLPHIRQLFTTHGFQVDLLATTPAPGSARELARSAAATSDWVIACGGDGTVHGVLQGVANTSAALGVLPCGTANALARNLGLPPHPLAALPLLLGFTPTELPLPLATSAAGTRAFTVMAGAGPDGRLIHEMQLAAKSRLGRTAYYAEAARLFLTRTFPAFLIDYRRAGSTQWQHTRAAALMASRIPDLGGLFGRLTHTSRLHHPRLVVQVLAPPAHLSLPAWFLLGRAQRVHNPWLTTLLVEELRCSPAHPAHLIHAQVDGEAFGTLPLSLTIQPSGLRLLMPPSRIA